MLPPPAHFSFISLPTTILPFYQACKLKFRLKELTSGLCFAAALSCMLFKGHMLAGLDPTKKGNELSQPKFEFTSFLLMALLPSLFHAFFSFPRSLGRSGRFLLLPLQLLLLKSVSRVFRKVAFGEKLLSFTQNLGTH